jgi:signal transduction histidine kinase/DNA-binding response OmpR family regulator
LQFAPFAVPIALPDTLRGKAIWSLSRLPDGRLAAGFEGGIALGVPGGAWTIVASPNGSPIQIVVAAHGRILAVGGSCAGFIEEGRFAPVPDIEGQIVAARAVPEGWLLAGPAGLWLAQRDGIMRKVSDAAIEQLAAGDSPAGPLVLPAKQSACRWSRGQLVPADANTVPPGVRFQSDGLWFARDGLLPRPGAEPVLPAHVTATILDEAGLIGVANTRPWILFATYWRGLLAYREGTGSPDWSWNGPGTCYAFARDGHVLLAGTSEGAFGIADPNQVRIARFDSTEILFFQSEAAGARLVTLRGVLELGDVPAGAPALLWPEVGGARVEGDTLHFRENSIMLPTRYINGLDVRQGTAAVAYGNTLLFANAGAPVLQVLNSGINSLASDDSGFLVGTHADGVQTFALDGRPGERLGSARAKVRAIAPGRVLLLFWNGDVHSARDGLLAHVPRGNPRDAALVDILRDDGSVETGKLAVLATRPDGPPVIGRLDQQRWVPLEVPGLAEIDAEALAVCGDRLLVAGRRGVLEVRMPLAPSLQPVPVWSWPDGGHEAQLELPSDSADRALLTPGVWEVPPAAPTSYRVRTANDAWTELATGVPVALPASWGRNRISLQTERNGLLVERELVVIRPYPWLLRPWALVLEALALASLVWALARWRMRHLVRQKRALESAVEQRTTQLRKANAAKEEFLASVSHEIRNPLNGVVGICAILQDSSIGPRERNFVRVLSGCAEQLRSMLDDVLDFSRIDRGEITLTNGPFEVCALIEEATRVMDPALECCTLERPETPQWLEGDAGKIRQIVCNLVSNALKYGRPREAGVELHLTPEPDAKVRLRLAVRNAGPTIPADELPRLFESFRRGASTDNTPGFGLGLAVCRRLAERMGGRMTAASADGNTEFALELVLPATMRPTARDTAPTTVSRALAIEDEDYNRLALGHALRALGYEIDWAVDGASALQLARRQAYDLILTDWKLPDIDGDELCRQLLAVLAPPRPPIVAVTAYSSTEKLAAARAAGMAGFVTKPITREKLEQLIRHLDTGPQPRPPADVGRAATPPALALLGDLAPTLEKLAADLAAGWQQTEAQARLHDPRAGRSAHALRSLLLLSGENDLAEQFGLLENAANSGDWESSSRLLPFLADEMRAVRERLAGGR